MLKLIVNADDFGLTPGCNKGILRGLTEGIVSDTTILINAGFAAEGIEMLKASGISHAGLHLNLTFGEPVLPAGEVSSLVDPNGRFHRRAAALLPVADHAEAELELRAQISKFLASGLTLNHLDSHHHIHGYPELLDMVVRLAKELHVPLRQTSPNVRRFITDAGVKATNHFSMQFYGPTVSEELLKEIVASCGDGVLEIMCHPADPDPVLAELSTYSECRGKELAVLTSCSIKAFLHEQDIQLISFAELG